LGCLDRAERLLAKDGIDSKDGGESPALTAAIRAGKESLVKLLIDNGAPVNPVGFVVSPPLWEAAHWRRISILKALIQAGAKVDALDNQGTTCLASFGVFDSRILKIFLDAGANPNTAGRGGETALMMASYFGYEEAARLLIEHKADVDFTDKLGNTALMRAAAGNYVDAIPLLLKAGADVRARNAGGATALDLARQSGNQAAAELLSAAALTR
jgi:ankyrin repeat protein